jgi:hypothetical protein
MNGVPLPTDAPSVAEVLHAAGYRTAIIGKAHFEPFIDPFGRFSENGFAVHGAYGPHRGFEHFESSTHGAVGPLHYARWLMANHPEAVAMFYPVLDGELEVNAAGGGATGAPQVWDNPIDRAWYHTDWVADRTISWLDTLDATDDWFCWMSFPDPHHPWDPPQSEVGRVDWRDVPLPDGYIAGRAEREAILDAKPRHWRAWYDGRLVSNFEAPSQWVPATLNADQVREVNARNAVEVELIDEALGRRRHHLHDRSRGAAGRLRSALQGAVPRRRADASSVDLAACAIGRSAAGHDLTACRSRRPRPDLLRHRRIAGSGMDARQPAAHR